MKKRCPLFFIYMTLTNVLVSVIFTLPLSGQTVLLDHPKDIVYDQVRDCFYITNNTGNNVVRMDSAGNFTELLDSLPKPMGLALFNDTLIISSSSPATVTATNVTTGIILYQLPIPEATYLSHMDTDPRTNFVYIIEQQGGIIKLDYQIPAYTVFVPLNSGLVYGSQTLVVDTASNELWVFQWNQSYIKAVSLSDSSQITNAGLQKISQVHASERVPTGDIYVSRYYDESIYRYESDLSGDPEMIASGLCQPAGLTYNPNNNSLYVCNYGCNTIEIVPLFPTGQNRIDQNKSQAELFPNPASDKVFITLMMEIPLVAKVIINNLQAETVFQSNCFLNKGLNHLEIPVSGLVPGLYHLKIMRNNSVLFSQKLIKN